VSEQMFSQSPSKVLKDEVYEQIKNAIMEGKLKEGDRILESDIAEQIGISRAPVREAIRLLQQEGLVVTSPHRGTFISGLTVEDTREIFSLRSILEQFAVGLCINNLSQGDIETLYKYVDLMRQAAIEEDVRKVAKYDSKFHELIYKKTHHKRLKEVMSLLNTPVRAFMATTNRLYANLEDVADGHVPIVEALTSKDAKHAAQVIEDHIKEVGEQLLEQMED